MPYLTVNGANIYYEEHGQGAQTIVFAHGLLWSGQMYEAQVAFFKQHYRCITSPYSRLKPPPLGGQIYL